MNLQPTLENNLVLLQPLIASHFETLFAIAKDPLIWEQHPSRNRYQPEVFRSFFDGAIQSGGAFIIIDKKHSIPIGSTRFYDVHDEGKSVFVGYTFFARTHWGGVFNPSVKNLMLDHAFKFVETVRFHIGVSNFRSQKAIEKLGAEKMMEVNIVCHGETDTANFLYEITRAKWQSLRSVELS